MLATFLKGASAVGATITNLAQTDTAQSSSGLTTYTFSNVGIGTADANRIVVVCVAAFTPNGVRFSSATIGGNAATVNASALQDGATSEGIAVIASRNVPSGTTANFVVTFTSAATFCGIIVYSFVSPHGQANVVDTYAESNSSTGLTNVSDTITTVNGGAVIGCRVNNNDSTTWTGLSEDVEIDLRTTEWFSGASALSTSTFLSWESNSSSTFWALPVVSYSPAAIAGPLSFTYLSSANTTDVTTYTRSGVSLGAADADRFIVVTIMGQGEVVTSAGMTVTSVTIGGVAATIAVDQPAASGSFTPYSAIAYAAVPTGTTGDIVVVSTEQCNSIAVSAYRIISSNGLLSVVDSDGAVNIDATDTTIPLSTSVTTVADGLLIATTMSRNSFACSSSTMTEDYEADIVTNEWANSYSLATDGTPANPSITRGSGTVSLGDWVGTVASFSAS